VAQPTGPRRFRSVRPLQLVCCRGGTCALAPGTPLPASAPQRHRKMGAVRQGRARDKPFVALPVSLVERAEPPVHRRVTFRYIHHAAAMRHRTGLFYPIHDAGAHRSLAQDESGSRAGGQWVLVSTVLVCWRSAHPAHCPPARLPDSSRSWRATGRLLYSSLVRTRSRHCSCIPQRFLSARRRHGAAQHRQPRGASPWEGGGYACASMRC
jgi:hypothetical protein